MKSGMGVRMAIPTLRRDDGSSMDGSAVGRYTPWVSPLTCMAKGASNPRWGETRGGEACSHPPGIRSPVLQSSEHRQSFDGGARSWRFRARFSQLPRQAHVQILRDTRGRDPPSAHRSLGPMR